ncbi:amino acid adenylation domain-containing protein [Streptomyces sp. NBC_01261]|uniref:amino acid adenylation domain-containing protein n=1 Tax=Streptomyces sp. NBC_01261 TaxID=2903802 RepID=UPI002E31C23C|nr:amino acid adenylation domain-containing protein [Streptomyces sp. NBC_01261]
MSSEVKPSARITTLRESTQRPVVVVDFNEFTPKTTLADVADTITTDQGLYRVDAVTAPLTDPADIAELARACALELDRLGVRPETVIGYCGAATLSLHLAARLTTPGLPGPRLVLVEPSWPTPRSVRADADGIRASLGLATPETYDGELTLEGVIDWLRPAVAAKLRAEGLPEDELDLCVGMLSERYRAWFTFLLHTLATPVPAGLRPDAVVVGNDGLRFAHPDWAADTVRLEQLPLPTGALLGDPQTARLLTRLIDPAPAAALLPEHGEPAWDDGARTADLLWSGLTVDGDAPAVSDESESITYRELALRAGDLAQRLRDRGVGPDTTVAVCAQRSVALAVAVVAILLADGAFLPLDPTWPAGRVEHVVDEAGPLMILSDDTCRPALPADLRAPVLALDATTDGPAHAVVDRKQDRSREPDDQDLAYVIYTSGSTGRPKGVAVPHQGLVNRLRWMQEWFPIGPGDAVLQKTPYTFDVAVWEFLWPLTAGARLVMARPDGHRDPEYLAETIRREHITVVHFVPTMLDAFLNETATAPCPSLRHVIASGEALSHGLANRFTSSYGARLHNLYGPTEASIDVTWWTCRTSEPGPGVPIGRPIRGIDVSVRDDKGLRVAAGEPGELYLGGVGLARGYVGRPDLTAASFVDDPEAPGERLYRTGDVVSWSPDGLLIYHGRRDHQVKLRGLRIEPGEIEAVACEHPSVGAAVAMVRTDIAAGAKLVLYVTPALDPEQTASVRGHLATMLPELLLPAAIVSLPSFPVTANGKCDRAALPAPATTGAGRGGTRRRRTADVPPAGTRRTDGPTA